MKIETPIIAIFICSLFFLGLFGFLTTLTTNNGIDITQDLLIYKSQSNNTNLVNAFDRINNTKNNIDLINSKYNNATPDAVTGILSFGVLAKDTGITILTSVTTIKDLLNIMSDIIGIPPEVVMVFTSIIMLLIVLGLIYLLVGVVKD